MHTNAAHPGNWLAPFRMNTDDKVIGNGKDFRFYAIGRENPYDTFFHTKGFSTAHGQFVAEIGGHIKQFVVIHRLPPRIKYSDSISYILTITRNAGIFFR